MRTKLLVTLAVSALIGVYALAIWGGGDRSPSAVAQPASEATLALHELSAEAEPSEPLRPAATGGGPRGRVLEAKSKHPLAGVAVYMRVGRRILASTVTGANGSFELPQLERRRVRVEVLGEGWLVSPRSILLEEEQADGRRALEFSALPVAVVPMRARLVDERTGEPVPEFLVRVQGPKGRMALRPQAPASDEDEQVGKPAFEFEPLHAEDLLSDAEGRVASALGFELGELEFLLLDDGTFDAARAAVREHTHGLAGTKAPTEFDLPIGVGPTYRLDMSLPEGLQAADFHATFSAPKRDMRALHSALAEDPHSPMARIVGEVLKGPERDERALLRAGDPVWLRFPTALKLAAPEEPETGTHMLRVRSADGLWAGLAAVTSLVGVYSELVPIKIHARAALDGVVLDAAGRAIPSAWIAIFAASEPTHALAEVGADSRGRFTMGWLEPGPCEVVVSSNRYQEWRSRIELVEGSKLPLEVRPEPAGVLRTVSGVLRGASGQHRSRGGSVTLDGIDYPGVHLSQSIAYARRGSGFEAEFRFVDVPSGSYQLSLHPLDNLVWNARSVRVIAPSQGLEFTCDDSAPTSDLALRIVDATDGAPLEPSWGMLWQGNSAVRLIEDPASKLYLGVPVSLPLRWTAHAQGYRLAHGDQMSSRREGDRHVIEARLERGWGQRFQITTRQLEPLAGVELSVDGVLAGTSDERGSVEIDLPGRPRTLEFLRSGWHVTWGSVDPTADDFGWGLQTPVYMDRD